jgi:hypothetical protein
MITPNMTLDLPTVSITLGPEWATLLNEALELIDLHDHSSGKGVKVTPAGLNINNTLSFDSNKASNLYSTQYISQAATLTGAINARSLYSVLGDLYYTNGAGNAIQITSGGSIVAVPGSASSFDRISTNANLVISPTDTFVTVEVDTSAPVSIILPDAATVVGGRIFIIKDSMGSGSHINNIFITANGGNTIDGDVSLTLDSERGSYVLTGDGGSNWNIV